MANLLPIASTPTSIPNRDERQVVEFLLEALDDSWYVYPNLRIHEFQGDYESDIILISPNYGVGIIEVKGGQIHIVNGVWLNTPKDADPVGQAVNNSYRVADIVKRVVGLEVKIPWAIWLPNAKSYEGSLPPGLSASQLFLGADLDPNSFAIEDYFHESAQCFVLPGAYLQTVINAVCPTANFVYDPQLEARRVRERLEIICAAQIEAVASLEKHKRVYVQGGAGTGKTALAVKWAYSALHDDEPKRVLLTCYNEPLGAKLGEEMSLFDSTDDEERVLHVNAFLPLLRSLPGMPEFHQTEESDPRYWELLYDHLLSNIDNVTVRFDRVIVDEAQDFDPSWLAALESLLDPNGDNEMFMMGDANQLLVNRGFVAPTREEGWVLVRLPRNVRNVRQIASLAYRLFRGAKAIASPSSEGVVRTRPVPAEKQLWGEANLAIAKYLGDGASPNEILVIASSSKLRDELRNRLNLVPYDARGEGRIVCETPQRAKGLEASYAVLVLDERIDDAELYVALTRAVNGLTVVSWPKGITRLGLNASI